MVQSLKCSTMRLGRAKTSFDCNASSLKHSLRRSPRRVLAAVVGKSSHFESFQTLCIARHGLNEVSSSTLLL